MCMRSKCSVTMLSRYRKCQLRRTIRLPPATPAKNYDALEEFLEMNDNDDDDLISYDEDDDDDEYVKDLLSQFLL